MRIAPGDNPPGTHIQRAAQAVDRLHVLHSHTVLDLGCGGGYHSDVVAAGAFRQLVDLDVSWSGLRKLGLFAGGSRSGSLVCADALSLPFRAETFDRVICSLVLYLLPMEAALPELRRVMRTGSRAYVRVPILSATRVLDVWRRAVGIRARAYGLAHVVNGFLYSLLGRQIANRFLRRDAWACYVPKARFIQALQLAGFRVDALEIDVTRPGASSIDVWVSAI
jgi:SAM-dependent methyltransferase